MKFPEPGPLKRIVHFILLLVASIYVFVLFVKPSPAHTGFNADRRVTFEDMIDGRAYRPFVYRTLMPSVVRVISLMTPKSIKAKCTSTAEKDIFPRECFYLFGWQSRYAFQYYVASLLMLICFVGFAHFGARLTLHVCTLPDNVLGETLVGTALLMGLPELFMYSSQLYDPPQLLLFTLSLYFIAKSKLWPFLISFAIGCVNKETTVVLVLVYALFEEKSFRSRRYVAAVIGMSVWFVLVKAFLTYTYRQNPGVFFELHLFSHDLHISNNIQFMTSVTPLALMLLGLSLYRWKDLPRFYRLSFISTAPILFSFSVFFGNLSEWRDFYEVYPIAFGIIMYSFVRLSHAGGHKHTRTYSDSIISHTNRSASISP